jgi:hypothetical protein
LTQHDNRNFAACKVLLIPLNRADKPSKLSRSPVSA